MDRKSFTPEFKDDGVVLSRIAQLNVKDHDGDVTLPGFFGEQKAPMIVGHNWSDLPVGKGRVYEQDDWAYFEGKFFLDTPQGEAAYKTAKQMEDDQEWSYGFEILSGGAKKGNHNGEWVRILQPREDGKAGVVVNEVSMVVRGAGIGTQTVAIKDKETNGLRFVEEAELVGKALSALVERAEAIADLRKGKLGAASVEALEKVHAELKDAEKVLTSFVVPDWDSAPPADELNVEYLRYMRSQAVNLGVHIEEHNE